MTDAKQTLSDPRGRAVAILENVDQGATAKRDLVEIGINDGDIQIINGHQGADSIDDSAKWFADTDELLEHYKQQLRSGATLISVPVENQHQLKEIQEIFYEAGARTMTNFGTFLTKTVELEHPEVD